MSGGQLGKVHCTPLETGEWEQAWKTGLTPLDAKLKGGIEAIGANPGAAAKVVYFSPQATAELFSLTARGSAAVQAALLSLQESLPNHKDAWPMAATTLFRDDARSHMLGVADSAENTEALAAWLGRAGLTLSTLNAAKAGSLAQALRVARLLPTAGTHVVVWVEDHCTVLAGISEGRMIFARSLDFGYWMLVDAMMRGARDGEKRGIDQTAAYKAIFSVGIPSRQQTPTPAGLSFEGVIPLMQPMIQRFVVEVRQTLRFSVPEAEQPKVKLMLAGTGAIIPNLPQAFESNFDLPVEVYVDEAVPNVSPFEAGELLSFLGTDNCGLLPFSIAQRHTARRLNSALRVGAAAATLALLAAAGWNLGRASEFSRKITALEEQASQMTDHGLLKARAERLSSDITLASKTMRDTIGSRPRWLAALALVSRDCEPFIELNHVAGSYDTDDSKSPTLTISGTAYPAKGQSNTLGEFVAHLLKSPVISGVKIVSTHATEINGADAKTFTISVQLKAIDADAGLVTVMDSQHTPATTAQAQERPE